MLTQFRDDSFHHGILKFLNSIKSFPAAQTLKPWKHLTHFTLDNTWNWLLGKTTMVSVSILQWFSIMMQSFNQCKHTKITKIFLGVGVGPLRALSFRLHGDKGD